MSRGTRGNDLASYFGSGIRDDGLSMMDGTGLLPHQLPCLVSCGAPVRIDKSSTYVCCGERNPVRNKTGRCRDGWLPCRSTPLVAYRTVCYKTGDDFRVVKRITLRNTRGLCRHG